MNKKCSGCGITLQIDKPELEGYVEPNMYDKSNICRRCFRLKFYGDYIFINKSNKDYENILTNISNTNDLVVYTVDMFNISDELINVDKLLNNPMILVLTKRDLLPKSVKDEKIIDYLRTYNLDVLDIISVSSETNYNLDRLHKMILKYKKSDNVYIVGNTNAGKSSLINKMVKNYSSNKVSVTTSMLPTTTLDLMEIKLNDKLTIIDTPGLIEDGNVSGVYDFMTLKRVIPKNEVKPRTYQIDVNRSLLIDNLVQVDYVDGNRNSFTLYASSELEVQNLSLSIFSKIPKSKKYSFDVPKGSDIVISGFGWIKVVDAGKIDIIVNEKVKVFVRKSIV